MKKRSRIILISVLGVIVLVLGVFIYLESIGRTNIIADYYSPRSVWDLADGDALAPEDIQSYIKKRNPRVEDNTGLKLYNYSKRFDVNPAFSLGIAEADSAQGTAGAGRTNKNPGNTKISHSRLDEVGLEHAPYKGSSNFTVFKTYADGYAAIPVTLANYSYYNLRGQIEPILRTYAGHPNPNYYLTVKGVMSELLREIDVKVTVEGKYSGKPLKNAKVKLRRSGKVIKTQNTNQKGRAIFQNLPRSIYAVRVEAKGYRAKKIKINSPQSTTKKAIKLEPSDRMSVSGQVEKLIMTTKDNENVSLRLTSQDGELVARSRTAKDGFFYFGNLMPGVYVISIESQIDLPTGFYYSKEVNLTKSSQSEVDFVY